MANTTNTSSTAFGTTPDGAVIDLITLEAGAYTCRLSNFGATVVQLHAPDVQGKTADIVLGFDNLEQYVTDSPSFGCCCGRVANRIGLGRFELDGRVYQLPLNHGRHHLHGGAGGFGRLPWTWETATDADGARCVMRLRSADADQGYPGTLEVALVYRLSQTGVLRLDYTATADAATPVNLTNHSYFNLGGHDSGTVLDHWLGIAAQRWTVTDEEQIPTGEMRPTQGTPWDFTTPTLVGERIAVVDKLTPRGGYDLSYDLDNSDKRLVNAATLWHPTSGRWLKCLTTEPAVQLYTTNITRTYAGKEGATYARHAGLCLETQGYPDAVNHPAFPSIILRPGEMYRHRCEYHLGACGSADQVFSR